MSAKKKLVFIINPISGVGKKNTLPPLIDKWLDHSLFEYSIIYTTHRGHAKEIAIGLRNLCDAVIAVGGDGSVNEVGSALTGSETALGIIPAGSGNGLARHLKVPLKFKKAILRLNKFERNSIDTGTVNGISFLGTCGFAFDAHIAKKFDEYHKRGFMSYIKLVIREFKTYNNPDYKISINGQSLNRNPLMFSVANSSQFGNGFTISPKSKTSDATFELVMLNKFPAWKTLGLALKFFNRRIDRSIYFESIAFSESVQIVVSSSEKRPLHIDGDPAGEHSSFHIEIKPHSLFVI